MHKVNNNKHLTKKHNICIGSHKKQLLLFSLVHLILCYMAKIYKRLQMKKVIRNLMLILISLSFSSCGILDSDSSSGNFSIYFLENTNLSYHDVCDSDINNLELKNTAWLTSDDIALYDFSVHYIYLNSNKSDFFSDYLDNGKIIFDFVTKPFVITTGTERIYLGSLMSSFSSIAYAGPSIMDFGVTYYPEDIIPIEYGTKESDQRNDIRIKNALISDDLYHEGISVELTDVNILENSDTSTIQYTYSLRNNDSDDLYIFDSDIIGNEIFNYYSNGLVLKNDSTNSHIWAEYRNTDNSQWSQSWFSRINSGESIERTITLKGYPRIPQLKYKCYFHFGTPKQIEKSERMIDNTRIWIGRIEIEDYEFDYTE